MKSMYSNFGVIIKTRSPKKPFLYQTIDDVINGRGQQNGLYQQKY